MNNKRLQPVCVLTGILVLLINLGYVQCQTPQKMSYQAVVRNSSNELITNHAVSIRISILQGSVNGTVVFTETHTPGANDNGLVSLEIGAGTLADGDFTSIDWANGPYFIKTETDPAGGTNYIITGTSQILSVPYALHAKTAENIRNIEMFELKGLALPYTFGPDEDYVGTEGGFIGFGHNGVSEDFLGYKNNTLFWKDSPGGGDIIEPDMVIGGKLGIGTDTLDDRLEVNGDIDVHNFTVKNIANPVNEQDAATKAYVDANGGFSGAWTDITGKPTTLAGYGITDADASNTNEIQSLSLSESVLSLSNGGGSVTLPPSGGSLWSQNGSHIYYNNGYAGIGTISPSTYLHINGLPVTSRGQLSLSAPSGNGIFLSFYEDENFKAYLWYDIADEDLKLQNFTAGHLNLNPYGGNVGIGTNEPGATLEVAGQVKITGGTPAAGEVLTTDENGLATWEPPSGGNNHFIGENYCGGTVFYVYDNGLHGLIVSDEDQSTGIQWYNGTYRYTNTSGDGLGAGEMNTSLIVAIQTADNQTGNFAAKVCADYSVSSGEIVYGDWYLPSRYELNLLFLQKDIIENLSDAYYWSSSELSSQEVWVQNLSTGSHGNAFKSNSGYHVRAIRTF
ncbi:MAG: DUF1566 domain-containing protein [Bacteroidales bacterium]|nr:DUF1566 domain-containing protein [Bacteroidales bacterium]